MKTMKWLIRREMWEHKGMLLRAPLVVGALMTLFVAMMLLNGHNVGFAVNGHQGSLSDAVAGMSGDDQQRATLMAAMARAYMATSAPIFMMLGFLVFFYCLGALHDERRDRSMLFWKSLPVSDRMTVLSKAVLALAVTPAITIAIGTLTSLLMLLMLCAALAVKGVNVFGALLAAPEFYLAPLRVAGLLPVYILWALPTVGWLLMVSSWARSKVFVWAVGAPVLTGVLAIWANRAFELGWNTEWFMHAIVARILVGVAPGAWFLFSDVGSSGALMQGGQKLDLAGIFEQSWGTLGSASVWIGVAAGVAMLCTAVWLRRWRDEG